MDNKWRYDVFLSFRGEDTRKKFTDHLYHGLRDAGINTFRDDNELSRGEDISSALIRAIRSSRISVIVFSENYAGSRWCLQELAEIMWCWKNSGQMVLPIFCGIDPSEVRNQKDSYGKAFVRHEKRFLSEEGVAALATYREALTQAASLSGWDLKNVADGHEAKIVKEIVSKISNELKHEHLNVAKHPVGLASRLEDLNMLTSSDPDGVRFVGICGIGGIGKTTLAKAAYNQFYHTFEGKSFLADIRECSGHRDGLVRLQEQLLCDILKLEDMKLGNIHRGTSVIKNRLCNRKVFIVLDDVNHVDQLRSLAGEPDWFGSGSIIIITTRNLELLKEVDGDLYMARGLDAEESLQLFSLHAFRNDHPKQEYLKLSEAIVSYSNGLPLALEVLGSFLRGRSLVEWGHALEKLKRIPNNDVQAQLRISFDSLGDDTVKALFLDIACFFVGWDKDYVVRILNACGLFADIGIIVLGERCLLWSNHPTKLMMHDLIRDMGREIVRQESPQYPGKRSRLWFYEDILSTLRDQKGMEEVEGIILDSPESGELTVSAEAFARMNKLRLLQLESVNVHGNYGLISKELRWLRWRRFSSNYVPNDFYMANLVTLEMPHSNLREVWKNSKLLVNLKVLDLSHSHFLIKTPNFSTMPNLEELILNDCKELTDVHHSIGNLERLMIVNLSDCKQLKRLPGSICRLISLRVLNISGCSKMGNLPESIGELTSLEVFLANGTGITRVPSSITCMKNLTELSLSGCKASNVSSIYSLIWSFVSTREVPRSNTPLMISLAGLTSLQSLRLRGCDLADIPEGIGSLPSLAYLDLSENLFNHLPDSISCLPELHELWLEDCRMLKMLPEMPSSLYSLIASNCVSLEEIVSVSNIHTLECTGCVSLTEISGLDKLAVADIRLKECKSLSTRLRHFLLQNQFGKQVSQILFPGSEIPDWFSYQREGTSISLVLPQEQLRLLKYPVTVCVVYAADKAKEWKYLRHISLIISTRTRNSDPSIAGKTYGYIPPTTEDHIWVYQETLAVRKRIIQGDEIEGNEIEVEVTTESSGGVRVKRVGVHFGKFSDREMSTSSWALGNMELIGSTSQHPTGETTIPNEVATMSGTSWEETNSDTDTGDAEDASGCGTGWGEPDSETEFFYAEDAGGSSEEN